MSSLIHKIVQHLKYAEKNYPFKIWQSKLTVEGVLISLSIVIVATGSFFHLPIIVLIGFSIALISVVTLFLLIYLELSYVFPINIDNKGVSKEEDDGKSEKYIERAS